MKIDHFVLTVASIEATCTFYERALGMKTVTFGEGRTALCFGEHKINLHKAGREFEPKSRVPTPGSGDFCLTTDTPPRRACLPPLPPVALQSRKVLCRVRARPGR